jgi:hypothetical protein
MHRHARISAVVLTVLLAWLSPASAVETQRQYLSGRDKDNTVPWRFFCTSGTNSGVWTNLAVPSHWDVKGFGTLTYKKDATNAWAERGLYEHDFAVPAEWSGKRIFLVFEGVMTDTSAKLNGQSVGPTHQGGFYRFRFEVTGLAKVGATNRLEVDVARHSTNASINKAERLADYWVFAGIYRPVYLEAVPQSFIERVAIDAKADGSFSMDVFASEATKEDSVEAQVMTLDGKAVGGVFSGKPLTPSLSPSDGERVAARPGEGKATLQAAIASPKQWTAETPNLYQVEVRLKRGGETVHTYRQRFGFRTFEVRDGDGLYLNGSRIILKGVNRHSAWPESGRCLSEAVHRLDIETIKDMNGNAVRMSHYPPDVEFLDLCDELGLYVLDELAGWHNYYDTTTGVRLVEAMVKRDVNHPSILFWDNGNEGGFNTNLDSVFPKFDPQQRRVLRPWAVFSGINTAHYLVYSNALVAAKGEPMQYHEKKRKEFVNTNLPSGQIYLPTEFMHGLYDGGSGAGLTDYWSMMMSHSNCAGGFIWVFADEAVKRPDTGELDSAGNQAPDGIVGPYREREGSFYTIKENWAPVKVSSFYAGQLLIKNDYSFTDLRDCRLVWQKRRFKNLREAHSGFEVVQEQEAEKISIPPWSSGTLLPPGAWSFGENEVLALRVVDPAGREVCTWTSGLAKSSASIPEPPGSTKADFMTESAGRELIVRAKDFSFSFSRDTGLLLGAERSGQKFSLSEGPRPALGRTVRMIKFTTATEGEEFVVRAKYLGQLRSVTWRIRKDGWLKCEYRYAVYPEETIAGIRAKSMLPPRAAYETAGPGDFFGVTFDFPEKAVRAKRWFGNGPYRVWKNRLDGGALGVWENDYNNTITGYRDWVYPEFKGFFAAVRWLQLETTEGLITVVPGGEIPFVQVLTPEMPPDKLVGQTKVNIPHSGLGLLHAIPPIGTKFKPANTTGPQGQPNVGKGEYSGTVSFYFGKLP